MSRIVPMSRAQLEAMGVVSPSAASQEVQKTQVRGNTISGAVAAPAYEVSDVFDFQSYFDDVLGAAALFRQSPNDPIVKSTLSEPIQVAGYGLALHPSSETPVAVQFMTGGQQGSSSTYRLKPGEVVRPQGIGIARDAKGKEVRVPGFFTGFTWGLPFGWLGGGQATLVVLRGPDSRVEWASDHNEIVYHRIRLPIFAPAALPAVGTAAYPVNWPQRFPWPFAQFGTSTLTQRGQAALGVMPTRTALSLRVPTVALAAAPGDGVFRMYWVGSDPWAQTGPNAQGIGTINLSDVRATDQIWGTWGQQAGAPAPYNSAFQTMLLTGEAERYAANSGALVMGSLDPQLQGRFVDIVRWGRL